MDAHDRAAAFTAFKAALAVSPSTALTYICGSVILSWGGEAERAIEWGERGLRLSPFDPWALAAFGSLMLGHFYRGRYDEAVTAAYKAVQSTPPTASTTCCSRRRSQKLVGSKKQKRLRHEFWNCTLNSDTADNFPAWIAHRCLPPL
jgi:hypothetical protein